MADELEARLLAILLPAFGERVYRDEASGAQASLFPVGNGNYYLYSLFVPPDRRGAGHGSALLGRICADADAGGYALDLLPLGDTEAGTARLVGWYERFGFACLPPNRLGQVGMVRELREAVSS